MIPWRWLLQEEEGEGQLQVGWGREVKEEEEMVQGEVKEEEGLAATGPPQPPFL